MKKYKVLKECIIERGYYDKGDTYIPCTNMSDVALANFKAFHFIEEIPEQPKTVWDLEEGDEYFYISWDGRIEKTKWEDYESEQGVKSTGNYFLTKKEAKKKLARRKAKVILERDAKGFKLDSKSCTLAISVDYCPETKKIGLRYSNGYIMPGIWFATEEDAEESIRNHRSEWLTYLGVE